MKTERIYFPGLNGLRTIASLGVVFCHTTNALSGFGLDSYIFGKQDDGNPKSTLLAGFGVSIFFALSGFLITYLLLAEQKQTNAVNIKNFYIRRALRIWPLYYLYLILSVSTLFYFNIDFNFNVVYDYLFLFPNIPFVLGTPIMFLTHYWSLGVEEQFYAFWPWVVRKKKNPLKIVLVLFTIFLVLKFSSKFMEIKYGIDFPYQFLSTTRFDCMMIGAMAAILLFQENTIFKKITTHFLTQLISWGALLALTFNMFHFASIIDQELVSLITVCLIMGQIAPKPLISLEYPWFDFLGKISYGVYVIHLLLIFYLPLIIKPSGYGIWDYILVYFSVYFCTILCAYISYNFFEKKVMNYKEKYTIVKSFSSKT